MKKPKASKKKIAHSVKVSKTSKISKKKDKTQIVDWRIWVILGVVVLLIFAVLINLLININGKVITGMTQMDPRTDDGTLRSSEAPTYAPTPDPVTTSTPIPSEVKSGDNSVEVTDWDTIFRQISWLKKEGAAGNTNPVFVTLFQIIFGSPIQVKNVSQSLNTAAFSAITLTLCGWLIVFLTFSDVISSFSTFSKPIAWGIGFALSTILAQFNWQMGLIVWLSKFLNITGSILVFAALFVSFVAFFLVNLGIPQLSGLLLMRRATMTAHKELAKGKNIAGTIAALDTIGAEMVKDHKAP